MSFRKESLTTRNSLDFKKSSITVLAPKNFLKDFLKEEEDLSGKVEIPDADDQQQNGKSGVME